MSNLHFFKRMGVFVYENCFDSETCEKLCSEAQAGSQTSALIERQGEDMLDDYSRRTRAVTISDEALRMVWERLVGIKPQLEEYFCMQLGACEGVQCLLYREGDFFKAHKDANASSREPFRNRKVSIISFLNSHSKAPAEGGFCGGELNLFGLFPNPRARNIGFPLEGQQGMLIAFRSDVLHEVTPVMSGKRYTLVSWFH